MTALGGSDPVVYEREIQYAEPSDTSPGDPFQWQLAFHECPALFKGFSGPVGSGKSRALCFEALKLSYENRDCVGVIGAPTYPMLRDSTQKTFFELLDQNEVPYRFHKSENSLYLREPRSQILFRSLENFERIRGTNLAWFGVDELTYCRPEAWLRLEARLRDPKAKHRCGFASWTPKGFDWVWERFFGPNKKPDHEAFRAQQNRTLGDYYQRLESSYDPRFYRQEALGEYLNVTSGQVYYAFSRERAGNVRTIPYSPDAPIWWALDFNINPMCSVIGQTIKGTVRVLDELVLPNSNTHAACDEFLARTKNWLTTVIPDIPEDDDRIQDLAFASQRSTPLNVYVYGDPAGAHRSTAATHASRSDWQIVRNFFSRHADLFNAHFRVPDSHGPVKDRVNAVNAMLCNHAGQRRLFVQSDCKELISDLEQIVWKADPRGNSLSGIDKSDPMRSHLSDALGYYIVREFPLRGQMGERGGPPII